MVGLVDQAGPVDVRDRRGVTLDAGRGGVCVEVQAADLGARERWILVLIVAAVFALGLFPYEPMKKTELAAKAYRELIVTPRLTARAP